MFFQICYLIIGCIIIVLLYKIYDAIVDFRVDQADTIANKAEINYWISKEAGEKEKQYEALLGIFYGSLINPISKEKMGIKRYDDLKDIYEDNFIALGKPVPKNPFI